VHFQNGTREFQSASSEAFFSGKIDQQLRQTNDLGLLSLWNSICFCRGVRAGVQRA
jgi:hypothetical protein